MRTDSGGRLWAQHGGLLQWAASPLTVDALASTLDYVFARAQITDVCVLMNNQRRQRRRALLPFDQRQNSASPVSSSTTGISLKHALLIDSGGGRRARDNAPQLSTASSKPHGVPHTVVQ